MGTSHITHSTHHGMGEMLRDPCAQQVHNSITRDYSETKVSVSVQMCHRNLRTSIRNNTLQLTLILWRKKLNMAASTKYNN